MSAIAYFFDSKVDTLRLSDTAGRDVEEWGVATNVAEVACMIQPLDDSFGSDFDGAYKKDFLMFCNVVDIKQGDRVVNGAIQYDVAGVESYDFIGQTHLEIRLTLMK